jgi:hypothetical protein
MNHQVQTVAPKILLWNTNPPALLPNLSDDKNIQTYSFEFIVLPEKNGQPYQPSNPLADHHWV